MRKNIYLPTAVNDKSNIIVWVFPWFWSVEWMWVICSLLVDGSLHMHLISITLTLIVIKCCITVHVPMMKAPTHPCRPVWIALHLGKDQITRFPISCHAGCVSRLKRAGKINLIHTFTDLLCNSHHPY